MQYDSSHCEPTCMGCVALRIFALPWFAVQRRRDANVPIQHLPRGNSCSVTIRSAKIRTAHLHTCRSLQCNPQGCNDRWVRCFAVSRIPDRLAHADIRTVDRRNAIHSSINMHTVHSCNVNTPRCKSSQYTTRGVQLRPLRSFGLKPATMRSIALPSHAVRRRAMQTFAVRNAHGACVRSFAGPCEAFHKLCKDSQSAATSEQNPVKTLHFPAAYSGMRRLAHFSNRTGPTVCKSESCRIVPDKSELCRSCGVVAG